MENISYPNQKDYSQKAVDQTSKNNPSSVEKLTRHTEKVSISDPTLHSLDHNIPDLPLCSKKIITTMPSRVLNTNITNNSDINTKISIESIFSPKLTQTEWNEQLRYLQQKQAQICGLGLDDYTEVLVQDLSLLDPSNPYPWKYSTNNRLIVVHGDCPRKVPLIIPADATLIGSDTLLHVEDTAWALLMIPKAYIYPHPDLNTTIDHETGLCEDLPYLIEPNHSLANLDVLGVQFEGSDITKVMQADCGWVTLKNNTITGSAGIDINSEIITIIQDNIIPTCINMDSDGYPKEASSFTQGVKATCRTYIGGCSSHLRSEVQMLNHEDFDDDIISKNTSTQKLGFFSPDKNKEDWQSDLLSLQKHRAKISGIATSKFNNVNVVDLATIDPKDMTQFLNTTSEDLIVVYGTCNRKAHLPISGGGTVIGSEAVIYIPKCDSYTLNIPRAEIDIYSNEKSEAYPYSHKRKENRWIIKKNDSIINTHAVNIVAGAYPLVYLDASNLIGVTIRGCRIAQCIVGSSVDGTGEIIIADCTLKSPKKSSLFLHDCSKVTVVNNEFDECHDYDKYPPIFHKCETIFWQHNKEDLNPYINPNPKYVPLFVRGE